MTMSQTQPLISVFSWRFRQTRRSYETERHGFTLTILNAHFSSVGIVSGILL